MCPVGIAPLSDSVTSLHCMHRGPVDQALSVTGSCLIRSLLDLLHIGMLKYGKSTN